MHQRNLTPPSDPDLLSIFTASRSVIQQKDCYFPCLLPLLLALILPFKSMIQLQRASRRRHRITKNLCPYCAYDLRTQLAASPTPQCPECGYRLTPRAPPSLV
ncbi:MAG TPA: hypothetical protein VM008_19160 [Phycisphaerae bacterium]|nr:hypothetical protein [Phycisphaerae bacterium]